MNRTTKEATVKRFHDDSRDPLRAYPADFLAACSFARSLKTLHGLMPYVCFRKIWTSESERVILKPIRRRPGLNARAVACFRRPILPV